MKLASVPPAIVLNWLG